MDAEKCENAKHLLSHAMQIVEAIKRLPPECADPVLARLARKIDEARSELQVTESCDCELRFMER